MNKILLILQREYLVRVRKRTFIIMTLLTPLLFAALFIVPVLLTRTFKDKKTIEVLDESGKFYNKLKGDNIISFFYSTQKDLEKAKEGLRKSAHYAILYIPKDLDIKQPKGIQLFAEKSVSLEIDEKVTQYIEQAIEDMKLISSGISKEDLDKIKTNVNVETRKISGEESSSSLAFIIGFSASFLIYLSVLLYGSQVMRGVIEEKSNRIIEVIITSVKPFQLMMGKILGIGLIGLTQFTLWIILTFGIVAGVLPMFGVGEKTVSQQVENNIQDPEVKKAVAEKQTEVQNEMLASFATLNLPKIIFTFLFYFLGGYLLYSAMFAAVASAVDNETDSQQFTAPITIPFIIAFVMAQSAIQDPDGAIAFWLSIIPFTSPIMMMIRMPFDVPLWQLALSMFLLAITFVGITWVAARIYRVGILMYGKKVTFKELGKWISYKP